MIDYLLQDLVDSITFGSSLLSRLLKLIIFVAVILGLAMLSVWLVKPDPKPYPSTGRTGHVASERGMTAPSAPAAREEQPPIPSPQGIIVAPHSRDVP